MHTTPETFFVEARPQSSTRERWTAGGPPVPARDGKDRPNLRLRSACDYCHAAKVKCSGGSACDRCRAQDLPCAYSVAMRAGKPKGSCNRKTLDKHARIRQQHAARQASIGWGWSPSTMTGTSLDDMGATWVAGYNGVLLGMGLQIEDQSTPGYDHLNYASDQPQPQCVLSPGGMPEQACCSVPGPTEDSLFGSHLACLDEVNYEIPSPDVASNVCANTTLLPLSPSETPEASVPSVTEDGEVCTCFKEQTESLNMLYSFHRMAQCQARGNMSSPHGSHRRLDICVQRINAALDSSHTFLSCTRCSKETCSVLLAVSSLQLVMRLYEYIVADIQCGGGDLAPGERPPATSEDLAGEQSYMSCRLGEYEVSPEESIAIRRLVVRRALQKGRETLAALKRLSVGGGRGGRPDGRSASGAQPLANSFSLLGSPDTCATAKTATTNSQDGDLLETDLTAADTAYLQQVVCRGDAVLDVFLRTVCPV